MSGFKLGKSKILKNFNLFLNNDSWAGKTSKVTLPELKIKTEEYTMGGLDTPLTLDMGIEAMQCEVSMTDFDPVILKEFGVLESASDYKADVKLKGATVKSGKVHPVLVEMKGMWTSVNMGEWEAGAHASITMTLAVHYYKYTVDGTPVYEIDVWDCTRKIGGSDVLGDWLDSI